MMNILVADDDIVFRDVLAERLERWDFKVSVADNGADTWNMLKSGKFRLLLCDWMMPGIDGVSLCRKIRSTRINGYIYIIMLSAKDEKKDTIEGLEAGADDYITKPFEWNELRSRIRSGERILSLMEEVNTLSSMLPI
jgi:DNA-binding response OmpR family regulator